MKEGNKVKALVGKRKGQIGTVIQVGKYAVWVDFGNKSVTTFKLNQVEKVKDESLQNRTACNA
jgi:ribosomal protein L24